MRSFKLIRKPEDWKLLLAGHLVRVLDHGVYPRGDGTGSRDLALCLGKKDSKRRRYFDFSSDMTVDGHFANPVWYDRHPPDNIIYYRNNRTSPVLPGQPPVMNKDGVDLWTTDAKDHPWASTTGIDFL